jgi:hypothetical protein
MANELASVMRGFSLCCELPRNKTLFDREEAFREAVLAWTQNQDGVAESVTGKECYRYAVAYGLLGAGKTAIGLQIAHVLKQAEMERDGRSAHVLYIGLDFSNGDRLDEADGVAGADVALASRILARCFGSPRLRRLEVSFRDALHYVAVRYRQAHGLAEGTLLTICLHLDEYQYGYDLENRGALRKGFTDKLAAAPGSFLTTLEGDRTCAAVSGVVLLPILTGTTREVCARPGAPVSAYSISYLPVPALTPGSVEILCRNLVTLPTWQLPRFQRIVRCLSGQPRALVDFMPPALKRIASHAAALKQPQFLASPLKMAPGASTPVSLSDEQCSQLGDHLESLLARKEYHLPEALGSGKALRTFLALALTGHPVDPTEKCFEGRCWADIEGYLLATVLPVQNSPRIRLRLAHWQLRAALRHPNAASMFPSDVLGPIGAEFNWRCFERLFVYLLAARVLALLRAANESTLRVPLNDLFPGARFSPGLGEKQIIIQELKVVQRTAPLVTKKQGSKPRVMNIPPVDASTISFEQEGNSLVDADTWFKDGDEPNQHLFAVLQAKFSGERTQHAAQSYPELRGIIDDLLKLAPTCLPIFVTNRATPTEHVDFLLSQKRFLLYNQTTIAEFLGPSLSHLVPCEEFY